MDIENLIKKAARYRQKIITSMLIIILVTSVALIAMAFAVKEVSLTYGGTTAVYRTRAQTVGDFLKEEEIVIVETDEVVPSIGEPLVSDMEIKVYHAVGVTLVEDGVSAEYKTAKQTVGDFLASLEKPLGENDIAAPAADSAVTDGLLISVIRAKSVTLTVSGQTDEFRTCAATVADFAAERGIALSGGDFLSPDGATPISQGLGISVVRVEIKTETACVGIGYQSVKRPNAAMQQGDIKLVQSGEKGEAEQTVAVRFENGKEVSRSVVSQKTVRAARDEIVEYGTVATATTSRGESFRYTKALVCTATAYDASVSSNGKWAGKSATGLPLQVGLVAVDPKVIPLRSRLYIEAADGSWVYGYAVAGDTGGAIKGNKVDLFYNTAQEAINFGRRKCKVYVLE